jgi:anti-sigma B factor antagonist
MELNITTVAPVTVVEIGGEIDAKTVTQAQERIAPLVHPGCKILLDMRRVTYLSSAGIRMLLTTYREVASNDGRLVLVGLSAEIQDMLDTIGFLRYFTIHETVDEGLAVLNANERR